MLRSVAFGKALSVDFELAKRHVMVEVGQTAEELRIKQIVYECGRQRIPGRLTRKLGEDDQSGQARTLVDGGFCCWL